MDFTSRYKGALRQIRIRWPTYLFFYGGGSALLVGIAAVSLTQEWYSFVILAVAGLLVLLYFLFASLWTYHVLHDNTDIRDALFDIGELNPQVTVVDVNLGLRSFPAALSRRLTTGTVIAIDVYNPQLAPDRVLARAHNQAEHPIPDPRLSWRDGNISLLPLPDNSVQAITIVQTVNELWQEGDRLRLLGEANRILMPGGCLLLAERVRTPFNTLITGPAGLRLKPSSYWLDLLVQSDFKESASKSLRDLILCIRVDKRFPDETKPLPVDN
jgi:SAM-dependent methyltransferase